MIDVVYKLGSGSTHNNAELRYSLRSLQNFTLLRNVYIVGYKPDWVQNIIHIEAEDPYKTNKDGNLCNKLILATVDKDLSEEFINMSDDQLFLKKCDYEDIKTPYINNALIVPDILRPNRWQMRLNRTVVVLRERNLPTDCFDAHIPYLLNKKDYARTLFKYDYGFDRGYCGNTLYFNTLKIKGRQLEKDTMVRLVDSIESRSTLEQLVDNKRFMNYTDKAICDNLLLFLQRQFPTKSQYEK